MMRRRAPHARSGRSARPLTALAVALGLLAQAMLMAFSSGAHAAPVRLDAFGNPLCIGSAGTGDAPAKAPGTDDCCTFGCHGASCCASLAVFGDAIAVLFVSVLPDSLRIPDSRVKRTPDRSALRSRGPPAPHLRT